MRSTNTASLLEFAKKYNYDIPDLSTLKTGTNKNENNNNNENQQKNNIYGNQSFSDYIAADIDRKLGASSHRRQQQQKKEEENEEETTAVQEKETEKNLEGAGSQKISPKDNKSKQQKPIKSKIQLKGLRNVNVNQKSDNNGTSSGGGDQSNSSNNFTSSSMAKVMETAKDTTTLNNKSENLNLDEETNKMLKCLSTIENEFQALKNQSSTFDINDIASNAHKFQKNNKYPKKSPSASTSGSRSPIIEELDDDDDDDEYSNELKNTNKKISPNAKTSNSNLNFEMKKNDEEEKNTLKRRIRHGLKTNQGQQQEKEETTEDSSKETTTTTKKTENSHQKLTNLSSTVVNLVSSFSFTMIDDYISKYMSYIQTCPPYRRFEAIITQGKAKYKVNERFDEIQTIVMQLCETVQTHYKDEPFYQTLIYFANTHLIDQHELCENILHFDVLYLPLFFMISTKIFLPNTFLVKGFFMPKCFMMMMSYIVYRVYTKCNKMTYQILVTFFSLAITFVMSLGLVHLLSPPKTKADTTVQFLHFFAFFPLYFFLFAVLTLTLRVQLLKYFMGGIDNVRKTASN